jgi:hypothetical protein
MRRSKPRPPVSIATDRFRRAVGKKWKFKKRKF